MAKKIQVSSPAAEVRKLLDTGKVVIGSDRVAKLLRLGRLSKVIVTMNCTEDMKSDMETAAKGSKAEFAEIEIASDEMGVACKKPFAISVIGVLKA